MNLKDALRLAIAHPNAGLLAEAERIYWKIFAFNPKQPVAAALLARINLRTGRLRESRLLLDGVIKKTPLYMPAHSTVGECLEQLGQASGAHHAYRCAIVLLPTHAPSWTGLANLAHRDDRIRDGAGMYRRALISEPGYSPAANNLAATLLKDHGPPGALETLAPLLERDPTNVRANAYQTAAMRGLGRQEDADRLVGRDSFTKPMQLAPGRPFSNIGPFYSALARALKYHPNLFTEWDPTQPAVRGGAIVPRLLEQPDPAIIAFQLGLRALIDQYIASLPGDPNRPFLARKPTTYTLDAWGNVLGPYDHQSSHIRNLDWMSGLYYVTIPNGVDEDDPRAGWIEFSHPGDGIPMLGDEAAIGGIKPEPGMVILFPSYVWHGTVPFKRTGKRISIAFDLHVGEG